MRHWVYRRCERCETAEQKGAGTRTGIIYIRIQIPYEGISRCTQVSYTPFNGMYLLSEILSTKYLP